MAWKLPKAEARSVAQQFGLARNGSEDDIFNICWDLHNYASDFARASSIAADALVRLGFMQFSIAVLEGSMSGQLGHTHLKSLPVKGRYVVFSDHHMTHGGNRHNFMVTSGNLDMYLEVLAEYLDTGFTLIENGDVEELVIFEPTEAEMRSRLDILDAGKGDEASWAELNRRRRVKRLVQLREIVEDRANADYYSLLSEFSDQGRHVRVAGNHDYDLQKVDFMEVLQGKIRNLSVPSDYVFLTDDEAKAGENVRFAILHGHQFDTSCVPFFAPKLGELFSESLAWVYQGPDRTWKWTGGGAPGREWVEGRKGFFDNLVTDTPGDVWGGVEGAEIGAVIGALVGWGFSGGGVPLVSAVSAAVAAAVGAAVGSGPFAGSFIGNLHSKDGWEEVFGHAIAWEYFKNSDPQLAITEEVETGEAFFKFRHLNEEFLRERLSDSFPDATRPKLLLGHSHEVRHKPAYWDILTGPQPNFDYYLNSGAAGRFENLLWAVEIIDGVEAVVSWSRPSVRSGKPERRVYSPLDVPLGGKVLQASEGPLALPPLPDRWQPIWLPSVLQMMMPPLPARWQPIWLPSVLQMMMRPSAS